MAFSASKKGQSLLVQSVYKNLIQNVGAVRFASMNSFEDDMQDLSLSMQNEEQAVDKTTDPLSAKILQAKLLSNVEEILNKEMYNLTLSNVNTCLLRISRQVLSVQDGEKRRNVQEWAHRMESRLIERVKKLMPLSNSLPKAQLALNLARHTAKWRPTDFIDMILLSISKNMQKAPEEERQSLSLQGISISLLAAAFNKSVIAIATEQLADGAITHLKNNYEDTTQIPSSIVSALIYSVAMLELKEKGNTIVQLIESKGGYGEIQNDDHLSMLLLGLFSLEAELSELSRRHLEHTVVEKVMTGKKFSQLQISHILAGCGGLRLLQEDQYNSICDRFQTEAAKMKRAYCLNEAMLGLINRGYSANTHSELVAAIYAGSQWFLSPTNRKISKEQQLSLLRGLRLMGVDRLTLKSKFMELKFNEEAVGEMLTIPQFGRDV
eukprot:TRINITY_DN10408_c0_g1_i1.p1 TRINITY_DN10408_c0_g1~~TRINITY_DN10408_c0_g1_i1.p1  ORF type:complete len:437 (-),score=43.63 TRINITY_DN10408_c0_g1_i1:139-1449(-)